MRKIIVAFFILLIISPTLGWIAGQGGIVSLTEKRTLASLPTFSLNALFDKSFYLALDKYFNDRFSFRAPLVSSKNWIDFFVFKSSPTKKVIIGKNGFLFFEETINDYLKVDCANKEKILSLAKGLQNLEKAFERNGQKFLFLVAPNKATIYPEEVKLTRPKSGCNKSNYDLLLDAFKQYPLKGFIRIDKLLIEAKKDGLLYHKTGTHWTMRAERLITEEILKRLDPVSWKDYMPQITSGYSYRNGGLAAMMSVDLGGQSEFAKDFIYISEIERFDLEPIKSDPNRRPRPRFTSTALPGKYLLPHTILFRDSFMTGPINILRGSFKRLDAVWTYNLMAKESYEDLMAADIVIEEIVERNLDFIY